MAFQAGAVNAGGFLACHRFVTHTTGFATHFGVEFAQGNLLSAFGMLSVPVFFLFGAMIAAYFVDLRIQEHREPNYRVPATIISLIMVSATICGEIGLFGKFDDPFVITRDYLLMTLLCLASGLQNAMLCNSHGSTVRTTHLTGLTTDLAIGLVRFFFHKESETLHRHERKASLARTGTIGSFVLGSMLSAFVFIKMQYLGFWIPTMSSLTLWAVVFRKNYI